MPEIATSVMPAAPVAPVVPTTPGAASSIAGGAQAGQHTAGADDSSTPTSFLDQLKAALAGLSRRPGTQVPSAPGAATDTASDTSTTATPATDAHSTQQSSTDASDQQTPSADELSELLAALGFMLVPQVVTPTAPPTAPAPSAGGAASAAIPGAPTPGTLPQTLLSTLTATLTTPSAQPHQAATPAGKDGPAASTTNSDPSRHDAPVATPTAPADALATLPTDTQTAAQAAPMQSAPTPAHASAPIATDAPTVTAPAADAMVVSAVAAANAAAAHTPVAAGANYPDAPSATTPDVTVPSASLATVRHAHTGGNANQGDAPGSGNDPTASGVTPSNSDPSAVQQAFVVPSTPQTSSAANIGPAEVVAQIAHQADLYRLPGNRGLRIQLHPEDLGGVQVTVRYGATGGLELHVNAEHATTGELVQSGWTELRDALATHGITPDRMVVSVAAPTGASSSDFSGGNNSGARSGGSLNFAEGQSQSGQQRQQQDARPGSSWNRFDSSPTTPVEPVSRVARDSSSRIDYRA